MATVPNVVLVHGAWADGSSWSQVIAPLQSMGHRVTAVQLPLTSLADDVAATRHVLGRQDGPVVLVGHSYGGAVISGAGTDAPGVIGLVYISAYAPDAGETTADLNGRYPAAPGLAGLRPDDQGFLWFDQAAFPDAFAADIDPAQARVMAAAQKPLAIRASTDAVGLPAWRSRPSWALYGEDDRVIVPDLHRFMTQRMGATTLTVPASHATLVSRPTEVVDLVREATRRHA